MEKKMAFLDLLERIFKRETQIEKFERAGDDTEAVLEITADGHVVCFSVDANDKNDGGQFHVVLISESVVPAKDFANTLQLSD